MSALLCDWEVGAGSCFPFVQPTLNGAIKSKTNKSLKTDQVDFRECWCGKRVPVSSVSFPNAVQGKKNIKLKKSLQPSNKSEDGKNCLKVESKHQVRGESRRDKNAANSIQHLRGDYSVRTMESYTENGV